MMKTSRRRSRRRPNQPTAALLDGQKALMVAIGIFVACCITLGGGAFRPSLSIILVAVAGTMMLAAALAYATLPWHLPKSALALLVSLIVLPAIQLVPLPPALWSSLPGHGIAAEILATTHGSTPWRPMTLSVTGTLGALLCLSWLVAMLVSITSLTEANVRRLTLLILGLGLLDLLVGTVQFMSRGTVFNFYNNSDRRFLLGFFANKNHSGLFLASMLLVGFALAPRGRAFRRETMAWMIPASLIVMAAIVATYSRAGLLLGLMALAIAAAISRAETKRTNPTLLLGLAGAGLAIVALLSTALGERVVARFGMVDNDLRWLFWRGSWPLAKEYFPFGAGFGTFEHIFAASERLEWVKPTYVNNAHNDYLEAVIEAGLPAMIVIGLAFFVVIRAGRIAWRVRHELAGRWALSGIGIIVLFAAHSVGDYPLRRMASAVVFFFALALVLRIFAQREEAASRSREQALRVGPDRAAAIRE